MSIIIRILMTTRMPVFLPSMLCFLVFLPPALIFLVLLLPVLPFLVFLPPKLLLLVLQIMVFHLLFFIFLFVFVCLLFLFPDLLDPVMSFTKIFMPTLVILFLLFPLQYKFLELSCYYWKKIMRSNNPLAL